MAEDARGLADRLSYPVGGPASLEALGAAAPEGEREALLAEAAAAWRELGRPLDAERCDALAGSLSASG